MARLSQEYISDANKHPLKPGKIGLLGTGLDKYFHQNSISLVKRAIKQELRTGKDSKGFLRMGIHGGRSKDENGFFGVLAPYLKLNTIDDVRNVFLEQITPHIFISANYGNLLHEFYNPCDPRPTPNELENWAYTNLNITPNERNTFELRRAYMSYNAFRQSNKTYHDDISNIKININTWHDSNTEYFIEISSANELKNFHGFVFTNYENVFNYIKYLERCYKIEFITNHI
jgi:hypothetical protein